MLEYLIAHPLYQQITLVYIVLYGVLLGFGNTLERIKAFIHGVDFRQHPLGELLDKIWCLSIIIMFVLLV